jgi:hypothetical protein
MKTFLSIAGGSILLLHPLFIPNRLGLMVLDLLPVMYVIMAAGVYFILNGYRNLINPGSNELSDKLVWVLFTIRFFGL